MIYQVYEHFWRYFCHSNRFWGSKVLLTKERKNNLRHPVIDSIHSKASWTESRLSDASFCPQRRLGRWGSVRSFSETCVSLRNSNVFRIERFIGSFRPAVLETISRSYRVLLIVFRTNLRDFEGTCVILMLFEQLYCAFGTIDRLSLEHCRPAPCRWGERLGNYNRRGGGCCWRGRPGSGARRPFRSDAPNQEIPRVEDPHTPAAGVLSSFLNDSAWDPIVKGIISIPYLFGTFWIRKRTIFCQDLTFVSEGLRIFSHHQNVGKYKL